MLTLQPSTLLSLLAATLLVGIIGGAALYTNREAVIPNFQAVPTHPALTPDVDACSPRKLVSQDATDSLPAAASPIAGSAVSRDDRSSPALAEQTPVNSRVAERTVLNPIRADAPAQDARQSRAVSSSVIHHDIHAGSPVVSSSTASSPPVSGPAKPLPLPLAFHDPDAVATGLNESDKAVLTDLRKTFLRDVGAGVLFPNDPAYAKRWRAARPSNDAQLILFFGAAFAERVALQAAQAEVEAARH